MQTGEQLGTRDDEARVHERMLPVANVVPEDVAGAYGPLVAYDVPVEGECNGSALLKRG